MTWATLASVAGSLLAQSDHLLEMADTVIEFARSLGAPAASLEQQIAKSRAARGKSLAKDEARDWREAAVASEIGKANKPR